MWKKTVLVLLFVVVLLSACNGGQSVVTMEETVPASTRVARATKEIVPTATLVPKPTLVATPAEIPTTRAFPTVVPTVKVVPTATAVQATPEEITIFPVSPTLGTSLWVMEIPVTGYITLTDDLDTPIPQDNHFFRFTITSPILGYADFGFPDELFYDYANYFICQLGRSGVDYLSYLRGERKKIRVLLSYDKTYFFPNGRWNLRGLEVDGRNVYPPTFEELSNHSSSRTLLTTQSVIKANTEVIYYINGSYENTKVIVLWDKKRRNGTQFDNPDIDEDYSGRIVGKLSDGKIWFYRGILNDGTKDLFEFLKRQYPNGFSELQWELGGCGAGQQYLLSIQKEDVILWKNPPMHKNLR